MIWKKISFVVNREQKDDAEPVIWEAVKSGAVLSHCILPVGDDEFFIAIFLQPGMGKGLIAQLEDITEFVHADPASGRQTLEFELPSKRQEPVSKSQEPASQKAAPVAHAPPPEPAEGVDEDSNVLAGARALYVHFQGRKLISSAELGSYIVGELGYKEGSTHRIIANCVENGLAERKHHGLYDFAGETRENETIPFVHVKGKKRRYNSARNPHGRTTAEELFLHFRGKGRFFHKTAGEYLASLETSGDKRYSISSASPSLSTLMRRGCAREANGVGEFGWYEIPEDAVFVTSEEEAAKKNEAA